MLKTDVLIIGSGIAGATTALQLARNPQRQIVLITRAGDPHESNTLYAQGGIIGRGPNDDATQLTEDILAAGAGASDPAAVQQLAEEGPDLLTEILIHTANLQFDQGRGGGLDYGNEGAHSRRRILHVGDGTGKAIICSLMAALGQHTNVTILPELTAVDLITFPHHSLDPLDEYHPINCHGAYAFDRCERTIHRYLANFTVLATGGLGQIYRSTTNPEGSRGDGLAMAHRAGARIANAEYVQFHPTALSVPGQEGFLISEALRGEGGQLLTPQGRAFMADYDLTWRDLAPRDVVSRAIHHQMEIHGYPYVYLDIGSKMEAGALRKRFPNIYEKCLQAGIDITCEPIPVVPAAHYFCGGILVDLWGRSSIANLYAAGEVSCTGVHGANRLASTSLLEGLVWGSRVAEHIEKRFQNESLPAVPGRMEVPPWDESGLTTESDPALIQGDMQTIQNIMWHYVGLVRSTERLSRAIRDLRSLWNEIETFYRRTKLSDELIGLRNAVEAALIIARAAQHNRRSRGAHFRKDAAPYEGERLI
jgi:L-aspartate oxidase